MKLPSLKALLTCALLLGALTLLYFKSNAVSYSQHGRFERGLHRLKQIDTAFNEDVLKVRFRLLNNYDGFNAQIAESKDVLGQLGEIPGFVSSPGREELQLALKALGRLLEEKHRLLEDLKSQNSVLRNSQSYFPEAGSQLIQRAGAADGDRELESTMNQLLREVLVFNMTFDEELVPAIRASMAQLRAWAGVHPQHPEAALADSLAAHARTILMRRPKVEALVRELVSIPSSRQADAVAALYETRFSNASETAQQYRMLLFGCCVLLLAGVALAFDASREANLRLEDRVRDRTVELTRSNAVLQEEVRQHKRTQDALGENEQRFRTLSTCSPVGIFEADAAGTCLYVNPRWESLTGLSLEETVGKGWRKVIHPEDAGKVIEAWEKAASEGREFGQEFRVQTVQGEVRWVRSRSSPIRTNTGVTGHVGTVEDITDLKRTEAERQAMELKLRHAQKMESIGQLAAGIAHEINTPTQYIGDNTRFLKDAFADLVDVLDTHQRLLPAARHGQITSEMIDKAEAQVKKADLDYLALEIPNAIRQSLDGVERVTRIVRAMKEFSHPGTAEKTTLSLNQAIESTLTVCRSEWKYVADMVTNFDATLPPVPVLPGEFNQVVLNIVINAAHAIADVVGDGGGKRGTITVTTRLDGDWAEIRISDTGTGIPEKARAKVFDPFFTTKGVGKGTGQGLAIAHAVIVEKHGGSIAFETEIGRGTTFILRLPLSPSSHCETKVAA